jgi:hypothetical protein
VVNGVLRQTQGGAPFALDVPVVSRRERRLTPQVSLDAGTGRFRAARAGRAAGAARSTRTSTCSDELDPRETAPSIGQLFGEPRVLAVLPAAAPAARVKAYRELALGWKSDAHQVESCWIVI